MNSDTVIANNVYRNIVGTFNRLLVKSGKPVVRPNGVQEWTVLSGICVIPDTDDSNELGENVEPIALATGVKCLPERVREYSCGSMVHDSHAEILVLRLFNWFLLKECEKDDSRYLSRESDGTFKWKSKFKLALYISEPPCGDASTLYLASKTKSTDNWENSCDASGEPKSKKAKLVRGRFGFGQLGIIRSKPGRLDSIPTNSKSCSDKLTVKEVVGLTNALTSVLIPEGIFLDYLLLEDFNDEDVQRCFQDRIATMQKKPFNVLRLDREVLAEEEYKFHNEESRQPSPLSLLHVIPYKIVEVVNNGVKNGSFRKNKPPKSSGESIVSNKQLYKIFHKLIPENDYASYNELKTSNQKRQRLKNEVRSMLGMWIATGKDDFSTDQ